MPIDIYIKMPGDKNYTNQRREVEADLDKFAQAIEMLLMTTRGTVLGYPDMGCNLDAFLWNPYITNGQIRDSIATQISTYVPEYASTIPYEINVEFITGEIVDGILINIIIDSTQVFGVVAKP